ncbi:putative glucarate transporter [Asticcacaulis biprosthecium C19]|uniref:Putative glucarate transporter n=1 Tax=Asticcacaulis biprosthecium C19 TaxID=715226 RepID=F4QIS4_9CAUL|nr:MFS transporter [Asticcacaulis biprosthecium]EGF91833.1 putative glucarate transporter [Asticcacaulis biprosthecium C19]
MTPSDAIPAPKPSYARYWLIALLFVITTINYADRSTFSIAGSAASEALNLSPVQMGFILSAFGWAYVAAQVPGGALLDRFGVKRVYIGAIVLWSIFTALQGFVGFIGGLSIVGSLFALRFLVGLAEAPSFPGNARIVAAWFPAAERGTASAIFNSAQYFALVAFAPLMSWLVHDFGWRSVFFFMGGLGIIAAMVFAKFITGPDKHPMVNGAELQVIQAGGAVSMEARVAGTKGGFSLARLKFLLTNRMLLGIYLAQYCINVLTYFFVTWFPIYLVKERGLNIIQAGFAAAAPALCGFIGGLAGGIISDYLLKKTNNISLARKIPIFIGMALALAIIPCAWAGQEWVVIALMAVAFFGKGIASLGWAVVSDVSPKEFIGLTGGVFNMFGNAAGIVTPIVIGYIVAATGSFDGALIYVGIHCVVTMLAFGLITGKIARLKID